jgi:hypothetical protein
MFKLKFLKIDTKVLLTLSLICLLISKNILAHGPSRQKVVEKIIINTSSDKVWKIVSNFSDFTWNIDVKSSNSTNNNVGALRTIVLQNNQEITQSLEKIDQDKKKNKLASSKSI